MYVLLDNHEILIYTGLFQGLETRVESDFLVKGLDYTEFAVDWSPSWTTTVPGHDFSSIESSLTLCNEESSFMLSGGLDTKHDGHVEDSIQSIFSRLFEWSLNVYKSPCHAFRLAMPL